MVDEIQQHVHAMRRILRPDAKLGADDWLKMHTTDRLHITNHDKRVREAASKNAAGIAQDQESAQAIAQGSVPWSQTPEALAERAKIEGQVRVANARSNPNLKLYRLPDGSTAYLDAKHPENLPEGAQPMSLTSAAGKQVQVSGPDGKPMFAMERDGKYYDQDGNPIPNARPFLRTSIQPKVERRAARMSLRCSLTKGGWMPGRGNPWPTSGHSPPLRNKGFTAST